MGGLQQRWQELPPGLALGDPADVRRDVHRCDHPSLPVRTGAAIERREAHVAEVDEGHLRCLRTEHGDHTQAALQGLDVMVLARSFIGHRHTFSPTGRAR
jgi:hypothetical protein